MTRASAPPPSAPVLIAGGGPVGLATALELSRHGIGSVVVEPRPQVAWLRPRAKTVSARTMEHFRRWGLAAELRSRAPLKVGWSSDIVFCATLTGREVYRFHDAFGLGLVGSDRVAEPGQQAPQPVVEQLLREVAAADPRIELVTGWRVTGARPAGDRVRVSAVPADAPDGPPVTVEAAYVAGCDGPRSVIRAALGGRFDGSEDGRRNVNVTFRAPGLAALVPHGPAVQYWVLNPAQAGLMGRLDLDGVWWCIANGVSQATGEAHAADIVRTMTGADVPFEVLATDAWTARMQLADRYQGGRMFIAGDAAHQNPPYGGHGFNTGVGDAVNLGWKLAAVLNGWAPPALLDSYEAERRPIGQITIDEAARNMATLGPELADPRLAGPDAEFGAALPGAQAAIERTKDREFHGLDLVLNYTYAGSPITAPGAGERLPHRWLGPGDSLYDHLGPEFTLIRSGTDDDKLVKAAAMAGLPLSVLDFDIERVPAPPAPHPVPELTLVRPDQHVSWRGSTPEDPDAIIRRAVSGPA
ncbi:MAG: FAD-dependent monooxygenase [Actinobacteria bacterium]|nr:FAD-dependent monooxygenase [Actinomycetota bacterium]